MINFFTIVFYQPIISLLIFLYNTISFHDMGVAIVLLTIVIRLILWPLSNKSIKSQRELQELQPKLEELKKRITDKGEQAKATMALYKEHNINPFSSCLPLLIQLPFLIAVYQVFRDGLNNKLNLVYSFIYRPETINTISLGFLDLAKSNIFLAVLAGAAQFWQGKMMMARSKKVDSVTGVAIKDESMTAVMNKQMVYMMPVLTVFIGATLPAGLTLYWLVITLLTALQQFIVIKMDEKKTKPKVVEGEVISK